MTYTVITAATSLGLLVVLTNVTAAEDNKSEPPKAEIKCDTTTKPCFDARTGSTRPCQITICKNEKGEVTSIDTIVLRAGSDTSRGPGLQVKPQKKTPN